jgi:tRNA pseudouridine55 synthase
VDGILNIDKPFGKTSYSVVAMVKRLSGERRVGHGGTLDPAATGVLPIGLGQGTRVIEFLLGAPKAYRAEIELGLITDTYDISGRVIQRRDPSGISRNRLESALGSFSGLIQQIPPMYSAVKYQGKPLYKLARAGITVERRSRSAMIYRLSLLNWEPSVATVEVVCGKGTYIRSLAHDLGQALGCGACVKSLIRLRCGPLDIKDAVSLSQLEEAFRQDYWQELINPVDSVLSHWAAVVVSDEAIDDIRNGRPLILKNDEGDIKNSSMDANEQDRCRAYALDGRFLGVLRFNAGSKQWQPEKVFL